MAKVKAAMEMETTNKMTSTTRDQKPKKIALKRTLIAIILIAVSSGIMLLVLFLILPMTHRDQKPENNPTAATVIEEYTSKAIQGKQYAAGGNPLLGASLTVQSKNSTYFVTTNTSTYLVFQRVAPKETENDAEIIKQSDSFLHALGFDKVSTHNTDDTSYDTYTNDVTTCQIVTAETDSSPASFALGCAATSDVTKTDSSTKKLLSLYAESSPLIEFDLISESKVTTGSQTFTVLYLRKQNSPATASSLFFSTQNDSQTYLGMRSTPPNNNGAPLYSAALLKSLDDKKYSEALRSIIEKY